MAACRVHQDGERRIGVLLLLSLLLLVVAAAAGERKRNTIVTHLKGFDGPLPFSLETGYVEVEETYGVELFYYFVESERSPAEDPVIMFISGGPGCSGLNSLLFDNGPLRIDVAGYAAAGAAAGGAFPGLLYTEESWSQASNVIFVDAIVGTGFSYAREAAGLNVTLTGIGRQLRVFLQRWMADRHPELASNPLYIGGDSYSGYTVTACAIDVANSNDNHGPEQQRLNLKGYILGNARGDVRIDKAAQIPFMHGVGLISDELYQAALSSCVGTSEKNEQQAALCSEARQAIHEATKDVKATNILEPTCGVEYKPIVPDAMRPTARFLLGLQELEREEEEQELLYPLECRTNGYRMTYVWANHPEVREALGVRAGSIADGAWELCPEKQPPHYRNDVRSTIPFHRSLTQRGYRALVYSGDHDIVISYIGTQAWIRSLGYPVVAPWRPWHDADGEVAGFTTLYAHNLTFATVKGAGHMAPENRPMQCLHMIRKWMSPEGSL